jgi:hypothetical protein
MPIPKLQLDALPILTQEQVSVSEPDEVTIVGSTVTKYWGPGSLGINGIAGNVADPDDQPGQELALLLGNAIDVRPCTNFLIMLTRKSLAAQQQNFGWGIWMQWFGRGNGGAIMVPPTGFGGALLLGQQMGTVDTAAGGPFVLNEETCGVTGWSLGNLSTFATHCAGGSGICRIWCRAPGSQNQLWYGSLWAAN